MAADSARRASRQCEIERKKNSTVRCQLYAAEAIRCSMKRKFISFRKIIRVRLRLMYVCE